MKNIGIAYFDCFSGISGDMVLGALVDAGAELAALERELRKLNLPGWSITAEKVRRKSIVATRLKVHLSDPRPHEGHGNDLHAGHAAQGRDRGARVVAPASRRRLSSPRHSHSHEHDHSHAEEVSAPPLHHRGLSEIIKMIDAGRLAPRATDRAKKIFHAPGRGGSESPRRRDRKGAFSRSGSGRFHRRHRWRGDRLRPARHRRICLLGDGRGRRPGENGARCCCRFLRPRRRNFCAARPRIRAVSSASW